MWEDLKLLIRKSTIPDGIKLSIIILLRSITYIVWTSIGFGIIIRTDYLPYLIGFTMACIFLVLVGLVSILVTLSRSQTNNSKSPSFKIGVKGKNATSALDMALEKQYPQTRFHKFTDHFTGGIIGNTAFVLVIGLLLLFSKLKGYVDAFIDRLLS